MLYVVVNDVVQLVQAPAAVVVLLDSLALVVLLVWYDVFFVQEVVWLQDVVVLLDVLYDVVKLVLTL